MTYKDATIKNNGRNKRQGKNPPNNNVMYALFKTDATNLTFYIYVCACIIMYVSSMEICDSSHIILEKIRPNEIRPTLCYFSLSLFLCYFFSSLISCNLPQYITVSLIYVFRFFSHFILSLSLILISFQFKSEFKYLKCHTGLSDIILIKSWNIEKRAQKEKNEEWNIEIKTTAAAK